MTPDQCIAQRGTSELIRMQKNLNASFVKRRDRRQPIGSVYKFLTKVEAELSRRGAIWFAPPRRRGCLDAIMEATVKGRVCDDVAWFDQITTLFDFCDQVLNPPDA